MKQLYWRSLRLAGTWALAIGLICGISSSGLLAQGLSAPSMLWEQTLVGEDDAKLRWPVAVASAADDEILVADGFKNRLILFKFKETAGGWTVEKTTTLPATPRALASGNGRYVVALRQAGGVFVVERPSLQLRKVGVAPGVMPSAIAAGPGSSIAVFDAASSRILILSEDGGVLNQIRLTGEISSLAAAVNGDIYASVAQPAEIRRYSADSELIDTWLPPKTSQFPPWPAGLAVEPGGTLFVSDRRAGSLLVLDTSSGRLKGTGSRHGWESGLLNRPAGIGLLPDGRLAVADQGNGRVQIFRPIE